MTFGLFTISKKLSEISVWNFRSVNTVRVVYHLPTISGLLRRTGETDRLRFAISDSPVDTSAAYKMKDNMLQKI